MALYTIKIIDIQIDAPIGWYDEEKLLGNSFRVSVEMDAQIMEHVSELAQTIDYASVCNLVKEIFSTKNIHLLETIVSLVGEQILNKYQSVEKVNVEVAKLNPLLKITTREVAVSRTFFRG